MVKSSNRAKLLRFGEIAGPKAAAHARASARTRKRMSGGGEVGGEVEEPDSYADGRVGSTSKLRRSVGDLCYATLLCYCCATLLLYA